MKKHLIFDFFNVILFHDSHRDGVGTVYKQIRYIISFISSALINQELLDFIKDNQHLFETHIFTNSGSLVKNPVIYKEIGDYFENIFISGELDLDKTDPETYQKIAKKLDTTPENIIFVDDSEWNVEAAREAGCKGIVYENNKQLFQKLNKQI